MKTLFRVDFAKFVFFLFVCLHPFCSVCLKQCSSDGEARMGRKGGEGEGERRRLLEECEVLTEQ